MASQRLKCPIHPRVTHTPAGRATLSLFFFLWASPWLCARASAPEVVGVACALRVGTEPTNRHGGTERERILSPNVNLVEARPTFQFSSPYTPTYEIVR